jgi:hypothetical protein
MERLRVHVTGGTPWERVRAYWIGLRFGLRYLTAPPEVQDAMLDHLAAQPGVRVERRTER